MKNKIILIILISFLFIGCFNKTTPTSSLRLLSDKDISTLYPGETFSVTIESSTETTDDITIEYGTEKYITKIGSCNQFTAPVNTGNTQLKVFLNGNLEGKKDIKVVKKQLKKAVYVYMAADNNMQYQAINDLEEMREGTSDCPDTTVIAFVDVQNLSIDNTVVVIENGVYREIEKWDEVNTGDVETFKKFIKRGKELCSSQENSLVIWNHGDGWYNEEITNSRKITKSVAIDETSNDSLNLYEIADGMNSFGEKWNILIFDACLMNTVELIYQLKDSTKSILGSPEETPFAGYDYKELIKYISESSDTKTAAKKIIDNSVEYYNSEKEFACYAYLELGNTQILYDKINSLSLKLISEIEKVKAVKEKLKKEVLTYSSVDGDYTKYTSFTDLKDLLMFFKRENIALSESDEILKELNNMVIYQNYTSYDTSYGLDRTGGVTIYLPLENYYEAYERASLFGKENKWREFIKMLQ